MKILCLIKKLINYAQTTKRLVPHFLEHHAGVKVSLFHVESRTVNILMNLSHKRASQDAETFLSKYHSNFILIWVIKSLPSSENVLNIKNR